jgi:hypothetical protein
MPHVEHRPSSFAGNKKIGSSTTYIYVDTTNNKIQVYVSGSLVHEWS